MCAEQRGIGYNGVDVAGDRVPDVRERGVTNWGNTYALINKTYLLLKISPGSYWGTLRP